LKDSSIREKLFLKKENINKKKRKEMEQNKDFLAATSTLSNLLKQQMTDDEEKLSKVCFVCFVFVDFLLKWAQRLVELHFEKCLIALAARKEFLLRELANKVNHKCMK
jgi:hypothetical protein